MREKDVLEMSRDCFFVVAYFKALQCYFSDGAEEKKKKTLSRKPVFLSRFEQGPI